MSQFFKKIYTQFKLRRQFQKELHRDSERKESRISLTLIVFERILLKQCQQRIRFLKNVKKMCKTWNF